jgi:hypothetical protein
MPLPTKDLKITNLIRKITKKSKTYDSAQVKNKDYKPNMQPQISVILPGKGRRLKKRTLNKRRLKKRTLKKRKTIKKRKTYRKK